MKNETEKLFPPASNKNFCAYQKEKDAARNVRGALKLEASTSTPLTLTGEEISIYVVIRNPFLVPVIIQSTETHIPVSLVDELGKKRYKKRLKENRKKEIKSIGKEEQETEAEVNITDSEIKPPTPKKNYFLIELIKFGLILKFIVEDILQFFLRFFQPNTGDRVAIAVSPEEEDSDVDFHCFRVNIFGKVDGLVKHFVLKTTKWLFFPPVNHTF